MKTLLALLLSFGVARADTITVLFSGDDYQGPPVADVRVDGVSEPAVTVTALHLKNQTQPVTYSPPSASSHTVKVYYPNDVYGGPGKDRNLYASISPAANETVASIVLSGHAVNNNGTVEFLDTGDGAIFNVNVSGMIGGGPPPPPVATPTCTYTATQSVDGCANAPVANANTYQNTSLISASYATRPPWNVAGVEYPVGIPAGTVLTDWQNISQSGVSVNTSSGVITISSPGVTLNAIDFTGCQTHSCVGFVQVYIQADNFTVTNSKTGGYNETQGPSALFYQVSGYGGFVMKYCYIDGGAGTLTGSQTTVYGYTFLASGLVDVEYNYFTKWGAQIQTVGVNPTDGNNSNVIDYTFKYNAMVHPRLNPGAHENAFITNAGDTFHSVDIEYNTFYQVYADNNGAGGNFQFQFANGDNGNPTVTYNTTVFSHNTLMAPSPQTSGVTVTYFAVGPHLNPSGYATFNGPGTVSYNYMDPTGAYGSWYQYSYGVSSFSPNWTTDANNIDMVNGNSANTNNND